MAIKRLEERKRIFGEVDHEVWDKSSKGFVAIPRVMPLMMILAGQLHSKAKGNAGRVYLDLWTRSFDAGFLKITDEDSAVYSAGYMGERGLRTWREHMKELTGNGFIRVAANGNKQFAYVLLMNPYLVVARKLAAGDLTDSAWIGAFVSRCSEVGVDLPDELEIELAKFHRAAKAQ
jgi:hypothetical protein